MLILIFTDHFLFVFFLFSKYNIWFL